jgi:hypothetical protein
MPLLPVPFLLRPPLYGWSAIARQVALTYTAPIIVALAAQQAGHPDLIRSPKRVLVHSTGFLFRSSDVEYVQELFDHLHKFRKLAPVNIMRSSRDLHSTTVYRQILLRLLPGRIVQS